MLPMRIRTIVELRVAIARLAKSGRTGMAAGLAGKGSVTGVLIKGFLFDKGPARPSVKFNTKG
jgi:hypothetical protein